MYVVEGVDRRRAQLGAPISPRQHCSYLGYLMLCHLLSRAWHQFIQRFTNIADLYSLKFVFEDA